ncbi:MAG: HlyD family secretion protein [Oceanicoccus sp.]|jgi:HlyD family secretion protein
MDIPKKISRKKIGMPTVLFAGFIVAASFYSWSYVGSKSTDIVASRDEMVIAEVTAGDLIRDVRAPGTLQPTKLRWIAASSSGRIEQVHIQPGAQVEEDTIIMVLSNPTLARDVASAKYALQVAEAELVALQKRLESDYLSQEALVAEVDASFQNATFRMEANEALATKQIVPVLDLKETQLLQHQFKTRLQIEKKRLKHFADLQVAEIASQQAQINQARSQFSLQQSLLNDLQVKAGLRGILQEVPVEQGQQITEGIILARVAREDSLKAELRVQESQVRDVRIGQPVTISAGGQSVVGRVQRIDPAVQNGVVLVDVEFSDERLGSARPDLRVDGLIELERLSQVLLLQRPVYSQEHKATTLYRLNDDSNRATLSDVQLGSASLDKIQVLGGLAAGDKVIVSDTRQFNQQRAILLQ